MLLSEIPWTACGSHYGDDWDATFEEDTRFYAYRWTRSTGELVYSIYALAHDNDGRTIDKTWRAVDALEAQCIIFHILGMEEGDVT